MIKTRITDLFGVKYPIIQGGMIWVSGWCLAAAVAKAGAVGLIDAGSMTPELLREHIRKIKIEAPQGVWGVNLPIFFQYADAMVAIILEEEVKVVFTSGGSPKKYTRSFKERGIKVAHVTATPELAGKCEEAGVDAVVVEGFEAGGHNGRDELTTVVLVPQAVDALKIPVIAAGGNTMVGGWPRPSHWVRKESRSAPASRRPSSRVPMNISSRPCSGLPRRIPCSSCGNSFRPGLSRIPGLKESSQRRRKGRRQMNSSGLSVRNGPKSGCSKAILRKGSYRSDRRSGRSGICPRQGR